MFDTKEIRALPAVLRLAGYLARSAAFAECGARLRLRHKHEATDHDEKWTPEEQLEWDACGDALDPWFDALSPEERKLLEPFIRFLGCLCGGEHPASQVYKQGRNASEIPYPD